jgi:hypothetical protein
MRNTDVRIYRAPPNTYQASEVKGTDDPVRAALRRDLKRRWRWSQWALAWFPRAVAEGWTLHQTLIGTRPSRVQMLDATVRGKGHRLAVQKCIRSLMPSESKGTGSQRGGQLSPGSGEGQSRRKAAPQCRARSGRRCPISGARYQAKRGSSYKPGSPPPLHQLAMKRFISKAVCCLRMK